MKRLFPLACLLSFGACISMEPPVYTPQAAGQGQRTILIVFPSPGAWVVTDSASKSDSMAKTLPVLGMVSQGAQDERYRTASASLQQYLPHWKPQEVLAPLLMAELSKTRFPGKFIPVSEAALATATVSAWNRAADTLDWQNKYLHEDTALPHPRDYTRVLALDDALVFEANLLPYVAADESDNVIPSLTLTSQIYRCRDMHLLWRNEVTVDSKANARTLYEFKTLPQQLIDRWKELMPTLAAQVAQNFSISLAGAAVSSGTVEAPAVSTAAVTPPPAPAILTGTGTPPLVPAVAPSTEVVITPEVSSGTVTAPVVPTVTVSTEAAIAPEVSSGTATVPVVPTVTVSTEAAIAPALSSDTVAAPAVSSGAVPAPPAPNPR